MLYFGLCFRYLPFLDTLKGFDFLKSSPRVALAAVGKRRKMVEKGKLNEPETNQQCPERLLSNVGFTQGWDQGIPVALTDSKLLNIDHG